MDANSSSATRIVRARMISADDPPKRGETLKIMPQSRRKMQVTRNAASSAFCVRRAASILNHTGTHTRHRRHAHIVERRF